MRGDLGTVPVRLLLIAQARIYFHIKTRHFAQQVTDLPAFPFELSGIGIMLVLASPTRSEKRTGGFHAIPGGLKYFHQVPLGVLFLVSPDTGTNKFSRQGIRDEYDPAAVPADALSKIRQVLDTEIHLLMVGKGFGDKISGSFAFRHPFEKAPSVAQDKPQISSSSRPGKVNLDTDSMFESIRSLQNPRIKNLVRLREGTHRRRQQRFLIEGIREVERAVACDWPLESLFFCDAWFSEEAGFRLLEAVSDRGVEVISLSREAFAKVSLRKGPDGILAVGVQRNIELNDLEPGPQAFLIILESLEKPGNIGAVFRTASAAGADALLITEPLTDPYSPQCIRSSQGAFFEMPFLSTDNTTLALFLEEYGIQPIALAPEGSAELWEADLRGPVALVLGAEDTGLSPDWLECGTTYRIPMKGITDSLNVASAAAVAAFEVVRQRST